MPICCILWEMRDMRSASFQYRSMPALPVAAMSSNMGFSSGSSRSSSIFFLHPARARAKDPPSGAASPLTSRTASRAFSGRQNLLVPMKLQGSTRKTGRGPRSVLPDDFSHLTLFNALEPSYLGYLGGSRASNPTVCRSTAAAGVYCACGLGAFSGLAANRHLAAGPNLLTYKTKFRRGPLRLRGRCALLEHRLPGMMKPTTPVTLAFRDSREMRGSAKRNPQGPGKPPPS